MNDRLVNTFLAEAGELIVDLERALLVLEKDFRNEDGVGAIFRSMHTLKGAAGMFGFESINNVTHHLESIYQDIRDGKREVTEVILATTFNALDHLRDIVLRGDSNFYPEEHNELLRAIETLEQNAGTATAVNTATKAAAPSFNTYYIYLHPHPGILQNGTNPLYLADDLLAIGKGICLPCFKELPDLKNIVPSVSYMGFEVVLSTDRTEDEIRGVFIFAEDQCDVVIKKIADSDVVGDPATLEQTFKDHQGDAAIGFDALAAKFGAIGARQLGIPGNSKQSNSTKSSSIRVQTEQLDDLMNLVSELVTTQAQLALFAGRDTSVQLSAISENIEKITRRLRDNAFTMSLVPLENLVVRFERLISDLSKDLNKDIVFKAEGMETKIDKSIIEKLTDPLLHLLRNSIDHGIEGPEDRRKKGKKSQGAVLLKSYYSGASVVIEISDDGAGINVKKIREKAISKGILDANAQLSDKELVNLIFVPGLSTATKVTGISGRGVGMDVVKQNITDIRGEIEVATTPDKGTTFTIRLPLTLSIVDGLLVKVGETSFILPLSSVAKCYEVETIKLESTYNHWVTLDGERTPFLFLRSDFMITENKPALSQIIKVPYQNSFVGIVVDKIEGEYQAVLKPLGQLYNQQDEFSGATILGDGSVSLVFDPNKLIKKLSKESTLHGVYNE